MAFKYCQYQYAVAANAVDDAIIAQKYLAYVILIKFRYDASSQRCIGGAFGASPKFCDPFFCCLRVVLGNVSLNGDKVVN